MNEKAEDIVSFSSAQPVWVKGMELEMNLMAAASAVQGGEINLWWKRSGEHIQYTWNMPEGYKITVENFSENVLGSNPEQSFKLP